MGAAYHFNLYNSLMLAGIIQGVVFAFVVLASEKYRTAATRILAAFILSFSLDNFQFYLEDAGLITEKQFWTVWFVPFQLLSGPLFLLYGLYLFDPTRKPDRGERWLFAPFAIGLLIAFGFKVAFLLFPQSTALMYFPEYFEPVLEFASIAIDATVVVYLYRRIRQIERDDAQTALRVRWFKWVIISLFALSAVWLLVSVAYYFYGADGWYAVYIGMSVTIYWMGHVGIYQFGVEQERRKIRQQNHAVPVLTSSKPRNEHIIALEKLLVDQKRFLDATLTLDKVADELKISKSHLSRTINAELGIGFPDYLNALRVEEAKAYLCDAQFAHYTLVAIGLEAGFNSKTTFNAAFKKVTSLTPSEYRKTLA